MVNTSVFVLLVNVGTVEVAILVVVLKAVILAGSESCECVASVVAPKKAKDAAGVVSAVVTAVLSAVETLVPMLLVAVGTMELVSAGDVNGEVIVSSSVVKISELV